MARLFEQRDLVYAEDLLKWLDPSRSELWTGIYDAQRWIWRGQRDATWPLVPKAFRHGTLSAFVPGQGPISYSGLDLRTHEVDRVIGFATRVDRVGLPVPGDTPELRDRGSAPPSYNAVDFPPLRWRWMFALAQHYGIPTRFLDWTRAAHTGAYFACEELAEDRTKGKREVDRFALWALNEDYVMNMDLAKDPGVLLITAPTATNPNLRAQKGVFTLVRHLSIPDPDDHPPNLETLFTGDDPKTRAPMFIKFTLPACEARTLLRLLAASGTHAASLFPGHGSCVEWYRECTYHQTAVQGERS